jgi:predicted DNA-binding transcriptional regulator YafY
MPKAEANQTLARQWELLKLLPTRPPGITAAELTSRLADLGYAVTKRTVERDLNDLARLFGFTCNDKGNPYGWHWMPGQSLDIPGLSLSDALSLRLVEDALRPLLPAALLQAIEPRLQQARAKLAELAPGNAQARWADKVRTVPATLPLLPPQLADGVLEVVQDAVLREVQIEAQYARAGVGETQVLTLHPLALMQRGPVSYLAATAFDYPDIRLYAVHRLRRAVALEAAARRPEGFDVDTYIASGALQFGAGKPLRLRLRLSESLAAVLRETPLAADQTVSEARNGLCTLHATVQDTWQLHWWLLSHADDAVVQAPMSLRNAIAARIALAVDLYGV